MSMEISEKRCWKGFKRVPGKQPYSKGSCMKESYKLIGKVLLEAGYKGIQFNRFGSDDDVLPVSARRFLVKRNRKKDDMYVADKKNVDRASEDEFERLLTLPNTKKEIEDFLKRSPEYNRDEVINRAKDEVSSSLSRNLSDLERSTRRAYSDKGKPRLYGLATLGPRGEAFIGRPQKSKIDPKTEKVVEVPYSRRTRQNQREVIGHEAAHVRLSRLPGILSKLGSSETLASAYGGFRAPVRGSSFMSRLRSAGRRVRDYGLPEDLKRIRTSIAGMLPSRFRKAQRESYELIGKVLLEKLNDKNRLSSDQLEKEKGEFDRAGITLNKVARGRGAELKNLKGVENTDSEEMSGTSKSSGIRKWISMQKANKEKDLGKKGAAQARRRVWNQVKSDADDPSVISIDSKTGKRELVAGNTRASLRRALGLPIKAHVFKNEESLHAWFKNSRSTSGKPGWVQVVSGKPCARQPGQKSTPKCVSSAKRASMTQQERKSAQARKRRMDPNQPNKSGAAKPTYVPTDKPKRK